MKRVISGTLFLLAVFSTAFAQRQCETSSYLSAEREQDPGLYQRIEWLEEFIRTHRALAGAEQGRGDDTNEGKAVITIPVVFHILYHDPSQNISDERIHSQISVLNDAFRRLAADTVKTPERFRHLAADCEIEFQLAISDSRRRSTTGIVRRYTPISVWDADDRMKFASEMGADAWDPDQYLNIWVCNLRRALGYASFPGGDEAKDGLVLNFNIVGVNKSSTFGEGKVAVHEVGHWLGLRHIWGDDYCGDDGVDDTPKQANFTNGCPDGIRQSCGNGAAGDMYMNYMDLTNDACINLFTLGQKERMRSLFATGGPRSGLMNSVGLQPPLIEEIPVNEEPPRWLHPNIYPNPARTELTIDLAYDPRWVGNTLVVTSMQGVRVMTVKLTAAIQTIDIGRLKAGMYVITSRRTDGAVLRQKLVVQ